MPSAATGTAATTMPSAENSTEPPGLPAGEVTWAVTETRPWWTLTLTGLTETTVFDDALVTWTVTEPVDGLLLASPAYRIVSVWLPTVNALAGTTTSAVPLLATLAVPSVVSPSRSVTVPVVALVELTATWTLPALPHTIGSAWPDTVVSTGVSPPPPPPAPGAVTLIATVVLPEVVLASPE